MTFSKVRDMTHVYLLHGNLKKRRLFGTLLPSELSNRFAFLEIIFFSSVTARLSFL